MSFQSLHHSTEDWNTSVLSKDFSDGLGVDENFAAFGEQAGVRF